jgi:hypothetical protein
MKAIISLQTSSQSKVCTQSYGTPKLLESQMREFQDSPGTKWHFGASPMAKHRVYYKWEGGGFPQVQAVVNLVNPCLHVTHPCTKVLQLRTNNLLFGLCKSVWVSEVLINLLSPIPKLQHAPLPPKCCKPGNALQFFLLPMFSPLDLQLSPSRSLRVRHLVPQVC